MAEKITAQQALESLDRIAEEWVAKDLEKGIPLPFRYWRGGQYKERITFFLWRSLVVPVILLMVVITCVIQSGAKLFAIAFVCYIMYWTIGVLLCKRESGNFILRSDGLTIATQRNKLYIPWDSVKGICSEYNDGLAYKLTIVLEKEHHVFYELYPKATVVDSEGRIAKAMMPLHVAYTMLSTVKEQLN